LFGLEQSRRPDTPLLLQANNDTPPSLSSHVTRAKFKCTEVQTKNELKRSTTNFLHLLSDINEQKKTQIWFFMRYKIAIKFIFLALFSIANDSQPDQPLQSVGSTADRGITGAWDSTGPHRPQPTAWSNAAAAAPCFQ
jgi:hypothetical protein